MWLAQKTIMALNNIETSDENINIPRLSINFSVINTRFVTYSSLLATFISDANAATNLSSGDATALDNNISDAVSNLTAIKTKITTAIALLNGARK